MYSFARFTLLALPSPMQAVSNHFGKSANVHQPVEFDIDGKISLDISEDGVNSRGWTIIPATNPVVKKEQVDRYSDGRRIPSCQISVHWAGNEQKEKAVRSFHKVTLKGTREPSFFQIECKPISTTPLILVLEKEPQLHELDNEIVSKIPAKWRDFGIQLGLPVGKLDQISAEENTQCQNCFRRVFREWQSQNLDRSWSIILRVLRTDAVGELTLATKLEERLRNRGK